jgi:DNA-binding NarL/FixJ family response regulator
MSWFRSIDRQSTPRRPGLSVEDVEARKIQVVVADDNAEVLMATCDLILEFGGVEIVSIATNVDDAVRAAEWHQPDLVFADAWLAGGGAEAVATRLHAMSPRTVVVALASAKELELVLRLRAAGAAGCYEKERLSSVLPGILAAVPR